MDEQITSIKKSRMYSDVPIESANRFNFEAYSDVISKIILDKENKTPFSIAINGKWGRGKTTLMKTIREKLRKESGQGNNRKARSVWFDAWKYSETDSMLAALVLNILEEMETQGLLDNIKKKIKFDSEKVHFAKIVTDLARIISMGKAPTPEFEEWVKKSAYEEKLSFYNLFQDYMKKILMTFILEKEGEYSDKEGVLVIFIDDLDRCPPKQITKVLESINLFFDHEGCFFVFGADISLVSKAVDADYEKIKEFSGIDYIKKMIQLQFDLPAISEMDIIEFMEKDLGIEDQLKTYFEMITKGLESNQREIKRFLNSLNLMRMLGESIAISEKFKNYEEELLIKWSILNFSSEYFIKEVNNNSELMIKMQEISQKENKEEIEKYIETLNEPYKKLCNKFKEDEKILKILKIGKKKYTTSDIKNYIFLSSVAPKEPGKEATTPGSNESILNDLLSKDIMKRSNADYAIRNMLDSERQEFLDFIISKSKNEDILMRRNTIEVLSFIQDHRSVDRLVEVLKTDLDEDVRSMAAKALGSITRDPRIVDLLKEILKNDKSANVRAMAAKTLGNIRDPGAVEVLIETLKPINEKDPNVRKAAAEALGNIGDSRALDPLQRALVDYKVRPAADKAYEKIKKNVWGY